MGKAYANRKAENLRPDNDFYQTPSCMTKEIVEWSLMQFGKDSKIFDPCCGKYAIGKVLRNYGYNNLVEKDLMYGYDFLQDNSDEHYDLIVMNPPFKLFDKFVEKAKQIADEVYCIGKPNYFGAHNRNVNGLWDNLQEVFIFDRMIAFDKSEVNGKVQCGMIVSCWFHWKMNLPEGFSYSPRIRILDMQKYIAKKGEC